MSLSREQQHAIFEEMANLENQLEMASMSHRISMVVAEALREHFCITPMEVSKIVARFAADHKETLRNELGLVYDKGSFSSVEDNDDNEREMPDPSLN